MVKKFTQADLEKIENEQELKTYRWIQQQFFILGLPQLTDKEEKDFIHGLKKCSPTLWNFLQGKEISGSDFLIKFFFEEGVSNQEINSFEKTVEELKQHFLGRNSSTGKDAMIYKSFNTYTELFIEAVHLFVDQWERLRGFGGGSFEQLFGSVRLGLYSAVDNCVLSGRGLNYPDLMNDLSPRLSAVKKYLEQVYFLRVRFLVFDGYTRLGLTVRKEIPGSVNQGQWRQFVEEVGKRLHKKFGRSSNKIFRKVFGSSNPPPPSSQKEFNHYQEQILTWIARVAVVEGNPDDTPIDLEKIPTKDDFHKDYTAQEKERAEKQKEEEERLKREHPDWGNIHPDFKHNEDLTQEWIKRDFLPQQVKDWISVGLKPKDYEFATYLKAQGWTPEKLINEGEESKLREEFKQSKKPPADPEPTNKEKNNNIKEDKPKEKKSPSRASSPSRKAAEEELEGKETKPPKFTGFNSSELNDLVNSLNDSLDKDTQDNLTPDTSLPPITPDMPISQITKEEALKRPWVVFGLPIDRGTNEFYDKIAPCWTVKDPATAAAFRHGSGDIITLVAKLVRIREGEWRNKFHNFFWMKNLGTEQKPIKGFQRLVKDDIDAGERERERERQIISYRSYR